MLMLFFFNSELLFAICTLTARYVCDQLLAFLCSMLLKRAIVGLLPLPIVLFNFISGRSQFFSGKVKANYVILVNILKVFKE